MIIPHRANLRVLDAGILRRAGRVDLIGKKLCPECYDSAIRHAEFPAEYPCAINHLSATESPKTNSPEITGQGGCMTRLTYRISEKLQRAEIAAGRLGSRRREIDADLTSLISYPEISVYTDGALNLIRQRVSNNSLLDQEQLLDEPTVIDAVIAAITHDRSTKKAETEEREKEILAWLALPDGKKSWADGSLQSMSSCNDPRVVAEATRLRQAAEARRAAEETAKLELEQRKLAQLTEAVNRLGTESQKERWAAGVMERAEALNLLWQEIVAPLLAAGLEPLKNEPHIPDSYESEKSTLTDEQWVVAKKAIAALPGASAEYYHQYQDYHDDDAEDDSLDLIRLTMRVVGEYDFECDVIL
jgi:hypothetical protein